MNNMNTEYYLIYFVEKESSNARGTHECGLYDIVKIEVPINLELMEKEIKAIKQWQKQQRIEDLPIHHESICFCDKSAWTVVDINDYNKEYWVVVKNLPEEI